MPIKQYINRQEILAVLGIALVTFGGIWESLFGASVLGWGGLLLGIIILSLGEKLKFWRSSLFIPLILVAVLSIIAWFITTSTETTEVQLSRLWAGIVVCLVYTSWAKLSYRQMLLAIGFVGIGVGLALLSPFLVEWALTKGTLLPEVIYQLLPAPFVTDTVHPNIIASLMLLLMPLSAAYFFIALSKRQATGWLVLSAALTGMMAFVLLLSKSRAGLLAGGLSFIFLLWFCHYRRIAKILIVVLGVTTAVLIYISIQDSAAFAANRLLSNETIIFRLHVWDITMMMLQDFPFTGVGMGTFNETAARLYPATHGMLDNPGAHNLLLQIGADLGLIGLIAMTAVYLLILYMGKQSIRRFARDEDTISWAMSAGLTTGIIAILLHGITDINVWGTRGTFAPWMVMGLISAIYASIRPSQAPETPT